MSTPGRLVGALVVLVLLITAVQPAPPAHAAAVWYVAPSGADSPACGTSGSPCRHIQYTIDNRAGSGDTINIAANIAVVPTYNERVTLSKSLTLQGAGATSTFLDGTGLGGPVLTIGAIGFYSVSAVVDGLTIENGLLNVSDANRNAISTASGAGILNFGTLTLSNSVVTKNRVSTASLSGSGGEPSGGGIENLNIMTIKASMVSLNTIDGLTTNGSSSFADGGGVDNNGTLTINDSIISGNTVSGGQANGGGIANGGGQMLTIRNSTISGNTASSSFADAIAQGGGIYNQGLMDISDSTIGRNAVIATIPSSFSGTAQAWGGGIFNASSGVVVSNSTVSANTATASSLTPDNSGSADAEGGGIYNQAGLTTNNVTIGANTVTASAPNTNGGATATGGGMVMPDTLANTIIAGNSPTDCDSPVFTDNGGNLASDATCIFTSTSPKSLNSTDPGLGPLQNNGGATQTQALPLGSPATNLGVAGVCEALVGPDGVSTDTDQRGVPRHSATRGACASGAYDPQNGCSLSATLASPTAYAAIYVTSASTPLTQFIFLRTQQYSRLTVRNPTITACRAAGTTGTVVTITGTATLATRQFKPGDPVVLTVKVAVSGGPVTEIDVQDTRSGQVYAFFPPASSIRFTAP